MFSFAKVLDQSNSFELILSYKNGVIESRWFNRWNSMIYQLGFWIERFLLAAGIAIETEFPQNK